MDGGSRTARRSSLQGTASSPPSAGSQTTNIGLSGTQRLTARGDPLLSSTGGTRSLSSTNNSPIIRSDPYDPANRKRRAYPGSSVRDNDTDSLNTSIGHAFNSSSNGGPGTSNADLPSTARRSSLTPLTQAGSVERRRSGDNSPQPSPVSSMAVHPSLTPHSNMASSRGQSSATSVSNVDASRHGAIALALLSFHVSSVVCCL